MFEISFKLQLVTTLAMMGVIWVIQLAHYPSFGFIDKTRFTEFETFHMARISFVVIPLMLIELATAVSVFLYCQPEQRLLLGLNLAILLFIWLFTFLVSSRLHNQLLGGFDSVLVERLVWTNWVRTAFWTFRSGVLLALLRVGQ